MSPHLIDPTPAPVLRQGATVRCGSVTYRTDDPHGLLTRWHDALREAPPEVSSTMVLAPTVPGLPTTATVLVCHVRSARPAGEPDAEDPVFPFVDLGPVTDWGFSERAL